MVYVLAFEEDGYARDVTRRYAKDYSAKTAKIQGGSRTGTKRQAWWERVVGSLSRPYRLVCSTFYVCGNKLTAGCLASR